MKDLRVVLLSLSQENLSIFILAIEILKKIVVTSAA